MLNLVVTFQKNVLLIFNIQIKNFIIFMKGFSNVLRGGFKNVFLKWIHIDKNT